MNILICIYFIGVIINVIIAASIWDELTEDQQLVRVRLAVVVCFVLASVITWLYGIIYVLATLTIASIKGKGRKEEESDDGSRSN